MVVARSSASLTLAIRGEELTDNVVASNEASGHGDGASEVYKFRLDHLGYGLSC